MFLFEGAFGTVLHTGDCRLTPDCLHALPLLSRRIDYIFLDCTFARCSLQFPTKEDSIRQVVLADSLFSFCNMNVGRFHLNVSLAQLNLIPFLPISGDQLHLEAPERAIGLCRVQHAGPGGHPHRGVQGVRIKERRIQSAITRSRMSRRRS